MSGGGHLQGGGFPLGHVCSCWQGGALPSGHFCSAQGGTLPSGHSGWIYPIPGKFEGGLLSALELMSPPLLTGM